MGSLWLDPPEDPNVYPMKGQPTLPFDDTMLTDAKSFPDECWASDFRSILFLIEFTQTPDWPNLIRQGIVFPPKVDSLDMKEALKDLVKFQAARDQSLDEILAQNTEFQFYFCSQLSIYPRSYPKSHLLLKCVARIGELVMVNLKRRYASKSVRPSHIYPRLTPPVPVPGHPSYPSGHATVSHLLALAADAIVPKLGDAADKLARRIAVNREIAGLHFWWDSIAGKKAAENTYKVIKTMPSYNDYLNAAKAEW